MTLNDQRALLAEACTSIGLAASTAPPPVVDVGTAWPQLDNVDPQPFASVVWEVIVVLGDASDFDSAHARLDEWLNPLIDAIQERHDFGVTSIRPGQLSVAGQQLLAAEFTVRGSL